METSSDFYCSLEIGLLSGQYVGNRKHGFGIYSWADGATEEGQHLDFITAFFATLEW